jgi:hypothetical protein
MDIDIANELALMDNEVLNEDVVDVGGHVMAHQSSFELHLRDVPEVHNLTYKPGDLIFISNIPEFRSEPVSEPTIKCMIGLVRDILFQDDFDPMGWGVIVDVMLDGRPFCCGIYSQDVALNLTLRNVRHFAATRIQRYTRAFLARRKMRAEQLNMALAIIQPIARAWYVSPNNQNHRIRMEALALKWGMAF